MNDLVVYPPTINWTLLYQRPQFVLEALVKEFYDSAVFFDSNPPFEDAERCDQPRQVAEKITVVPPNFDPTILQPFDLYYSLSNHANWVHQYPEIGKIYYDFLDWPVSNQSWSALVNSFQRADITLCVSDKLYNYAEKYTKPIYVPNGVDWMLFDQNTDSYIKNWLDVLKSEGTRIIGFAGVFWEHVTDWELFVKIANAFPEDKFVMTGAFMDKYGELPENVVWLGHVDRADLPGVMNQFDVAVIPFLKNDFTEAMCPLKFFEYVAAGCPVVSTPIPEVERHEMAYIGRDHEHFIERIEIALEEDSKSKRVGRKRKAQEFDWSVVLKPFLEEIRNR